MDPISIALGVASVAAPWLTKLITGSDKAADRATEIVDLAKRVTGVEDETKLVDAFQASPELRLQFEREAMQLTLSLYQEDTKRLQAVNETMRAEYASSDAFVRRARPTWMYVCAYTWGIQVIAVSVGILYGTIITPQYSKEIFVGISELISAMTIMWSVALTALGVYVRERSREKAIKAGVEPATILSGVTKILGRGK